MKLLVTGAGGLVGSESLRMSLRDKDSEIWALSSKKLNFENINLFNNYEKIGNEVFDLVIHCAASTPNNSDKESIYEKNKIIDASLSKFIIKNKPKHVVYLSTMAIYGKITEQIINEETLPKDLDGYGESKLQGESTILKSCEENDIKTTVLRLPGVVDPKMPLVFFRRVYENLKNNVDIKVQSKNAKFNNAIFSSDIYLTCINCFLHQKSNKKILNLHSKDTLTLNQFISYFASKLRVNPKIIVDNSVNPPFLISNKEEANLLRTRNIAEIINSFLERL